MKNKFINRPTCAVILSILGLVFILTAFIVARTTTLFNIEYDYSQQDVTRYKVSILWSWASLYLAFMLVGAFILFVKFRFCTFKHYKLDPNNKLLMANLVIEILAIILTFIAAFGIFMYKKDGIIPEAPAIPDYVNINKPYTVLSSMALGLSFFGSVTNLIVLAKE